MTTETRYMQVPSWTVNGLTASKLSSQEVSSTVATQETGGEETVYWAWDIIKRTAVGGETVIGSKVAQVTRNAEGEGIQSATWNCPLTVLSPTDAIRAISYGSFDGVFWSMMDYPEYVGWITEQLGATNLNAVTWTCYVYTRIALIEEEYYLFVYWGDSTYNTRVEGFSWTPPAAGGLRMIPSLKGHMGYDLKTRGGKARRRVF